jgi:formylglycine-generating enzyme required for sulfatase activity
MNMNFMRSWPPFIPFLAWLLFAGTGLPIGHAAGATLAQNNEQLLRLLQQEHRLTEQQMAEVALIFKRSGVIGQGNPAISVHPQTPAQCRAANPPQPNPAFERICGGPHMAPLYDPQHETAEQARSCIDQFEFPDLPCEYPVVWIKAREAAQVCAAIGKRLCDAHEWEGACEGRLLAPDYRFDLAGNPDSGAAVSRMAQAHNRAWSASKRWAYGPQYSRGICATGSQKSPGCNGGGWNDCGSNTYPAAAFPACRSALGVFDQHGNAAEHMNLPLAAEQMASRGSRSLGHTEMKGSWFIFDSYRAHEDWCRWRAPYWHGSRVLDPHSHANYHLGFRCCKSLPGPAER